MTTTAPEAPATWRLLARAARSMLQGDAGEGARLPDEAIVRPDVAIDRDHLAAYARVCGFDLTDTLPSTYLHVVAFPLQLALLTRPTFPFPLPGLVHVANAITVHRPVTADERPTVEVRLERLRPHPSGRQFDAVTTARVAGDVVWEEASTYLRRGDDGDEDAERPGPEVDLEPDPSAPLVEARPDTGRRYAAVSGDRNPIHLHPLTARAFGFPRAIAHGMWTQARALALLQPRLPDHGTISTRFERPVLLPSKMTLTSSVDGDRLAFALHDTRRARRHLAGEVTW